MRGPSAFQVTLRNFSVWRSAVATLTLGVTALLAAWATHPGAGRNLPMAWVIPASIGVALVLAVQLWRVPAVTLSCDGERWQLRMAQSEFSEPVAGRLEVRLDLGNWMLLRFVPEAPAAGVRSRWLPAQRGTSDQHWHALRCALYSPLRSAAGRAADNA